MKKLPWTDDEVKNLNDYQDCGYFHPFTHCNHQNLVATNNGWVCPKCNSKQDWCHEWMANGEWKKNLPELEKLYSDPRVQKLLAGQITIG